MAYNKERDMAFDGGVVAMVAREAVARAIKAFGAIVQVSREDFKKILTKTEKPLVVMATGGIFKKTTSI
jgi:hypothetical protein